jgi:hypothetical protein
MKLFFTQLTITHGEVEFPVPMVIKAEDLETATDKAVSWAKDFYSDGEQTENGFEYSSGELIIGSLGYIHEMTEKEIKDRLYNDALIR